VKYTSKRGELI